MTNLEFHTWLKYHRAAFPRIAVWMSEGDNDAEATMAHWDAVLRSEHGPSIVFSDAKNWAKGPMQAICVAELWLIFAFDNHHFQFSAR